MICHCYYCYNCYYEEMLQCKYLVKTEVINMKYADVLQKFICLTKTTTSVINGIKYKYSLITCNTENRHINFVDVRSPYFFIL